MDEIYAIDWDDEIAGGSDRDRTTLSADTLWEEDKREKRMSDGYLGTSAYLPYGTYVVVEQQPRYAGSEYDRNHQDFKNKHYQIDRPREISLPSVYEDTAGAQTSPEIKNRYYCYDSTMTQQEQERRYRIRFGQEDHVIRAHSHHGDFEIYKYGMDVGQVTNGVPPLPGSGDYFALTQEEYKPYQNYYNHMDNPREAEVDYYLTEGLSGRRGIAPHYRYSSLSEHGGRRDDVPYVMETTAEHGMTEITYRDQVTVMHGMQTAFDGLYAPALVPWSVVSPAGAGSGYAESGEKEESGESCYRGFGYVKFRNRFFAAKLRLEKLDSETHENILHDEAIFAIYAAKRDAAREDRKSVV